MGFENFLQMGGEEFEIHRGDQVTQAKGLRNGSKQREYIGFRPGTDIIAGDLLTGKLSGKTYRVFETDRQIVHGSVFQVMAYVEPDRHRETTPTYSINVGTMIGSGIQQGSPNSVQTLTGNSTIDSARDIIAQISDLLDKLGLNEEDKHEIHADAKTAATQVEASKPKTGIIKACFVAIRDKLSAAVASGVAVAAKPIIEKLTAWISGA